MIYTSEQIIESLRVCANNTTAQGCNGCVNSEIYSSDCLMNLMILAANMLENLTEAAQAAKEAMASNLSNENKNVALLPYIEDLGNSNKVKMMLDDFAYAPVRAHSTDAGLDLRSPFDIEIMPGNSVTINTGVHIQLPAGTVGMLKSKSGLNVKHGITSEGVIDEGYTGSIVAKLYNNSRKCYKVSAGDKITQLVILPCLTPDFELVESLDPSERGNNGFGSSGV